ncbi:3'-5' exonuclease eri-1 [Trichinella pseudospiralis]
MKCQMILMSSYLTVLIHRFILLLMVSSFHSYCRPIINPVLSKFCTRLTGIKRENVDSAPLFPEVFKQFFQWIKTETDGKSVAFVTDGNQDIAIFLQNFISILIFRKKCKGGLI